MTSLRDNGIIIVKAAGGVTTTYFYDGNTLTGENRSDGKRLRYFYDTTGLCGFSYFNGSNTKYYTYVKDVLGNIVMIKDDLGLLMTKYSYDEWGNCTANNLVGTIGNVNPFRYRGYYYDTESGLYYLMSRYYDPEIGQFISMDTSDYLDPETIGGVDLYAYCGYNPIMYVDPNGHIPVDTIIDIGFFFWSFIDFIRHPSWENAGWCALDLVCFIVPYATGGSTAVKGIVKGVNGADNLLDASKVPGYIMRNADDVVLLGQNMDRVHDASRKMGGGIIYGGLDDFTSIKLKYGKDFAEALGYADNMKWIRKQAWSGKTVLNIGVELKRLEDPIKYANSFKVCKGELFWYRMVMLGKFVAFWSHRIYRLLFGDF